MQWLSKQNITKDEIDQTLRKIITEKYDPPYRQIHWQAVVIPVFLKNLSVKPPPNKETQTLRKGLNTRWIHYANPYAQNKLETQQQNVLIKFFNYLNLSAKEIDLAATARHLSEALLQAHYYIPTNLIKKLLINISKNVQRHHMAAYDSKPCPTHVSTKWDEKSLEDLKKELQEHFKVQPDDINRLFKLEEESFFQTTKQKKQRRYKIKKHESASDHEADTGSRYHEKRKKYLISPSTMGYDTVSDFSHDSNGTPPLKKTNSPLYSLSFMTGASHNSTLTHQECPSIPQDRNTHQSQIFPSYQGDLPIGSNALSWSNAPAGQEFIYLLGEAPSHKFI